MDNPFKIDYTLSIESIIAALAILGAAIGFVFNLIKSWRTDSKEKKYRGTNHIILDLLEIHFENGLSEEELWNLYCHPETLGKRESFGAYSPNKLTRFGFENQLKHLQSKFLIRLTGPAHYNIDFSEPREWRRFSKRKSFSKIVSAVRERIGHSELNGLLKATIDYERYNEYGIKDLYAYLIENGDTQIIETLVSDINSTDIVKRQKAVELFISINQHVE